MGGIIFYCCLFIAVGLVYGDLVIEPSDSSLYYIGRVDKSNALQYNLSWPGVEIYLEISNSSNVHCLMSSTKDNTFNVYVNDQYVNLINITSSDIAAYELVPGGLDPDQVYTVSLRHRNEAACGLVSFQGFIVEDMAIVSKYSSSITRRIEIIGDSISVGFGLKGTPPCLFNINQEDTSLAYGSLIANALDAELQTIAYSGIALVKFCSNCSDFIDGYNFTSPAVLPLLYPLINPKLGPKSGRWDFTEYQPNVVIINLGTNDYEHPPVPSQRLFINRYVQFIQFIQSKYTESNPKFFLICGPMIGGPSCLYVETVAQLTNSTYIDMQNILEEDEYGCAGHPNVLGHVTMAKLAIPVIQDVMNWN
ncbi:esterase [Tieghemostelium lacteum]|uniref:Esterase n=1 Tax=Tieghemostelium lacteum TaxID=361077 RepID=A0A151ZHH4_TIELA|nr:esterase [Tieghemostelium lacteum]|eukprot:KYQ93365.1 esterase [Tieghemostelium lacteum]